MKINKKLWSTVLLLALVLTVSLLFTSCKTTPVDPPEQSTTAEEEGTTSAPESPTLEIARDGKLSIARVVRPADIASNAPEIATAKTLRDAINNIMNDDFGLDLAYDEKLAMEEDFLMPGQTYMIRPPLRYSLARPHMTRARARLTDFPTATMP